jgi:hypothetical protein
VISMEEIAAFLTHKRGPNTQSWLVEESQPEMVFGLLRGIGRYNAFDPDLVEDFLRAKWNELQLTNVAVGCYPVPTVHLIGRRKFTTSMTMFNLESEMRDKIITVCKMWLDADNVFIDDGMLKIWWN